MDGGFSARSMAAFCVAAWAHRRGGMRFGASGVSVYGTIACTLREAQRSGRQAFIIHHVELNITKISTSS